MAMQFNVPDPVEREIRSLRKEAAKLRIQRNEARAVAGVLRTELAEAQQRIAMLVCDLADARDGVR